MVPRVVSRPVLTASPSSRLESPLALTATAKALEFVTLAALVTLVPRVLGPADYGTLAIAMSVVAIGSLALSAGGPTLMSSYLPRVPAESRPALARALALRVGRWRLFASVLILLVATVLCAVAPDAFPAGVTLLVALALVLELAATLVFSVALGLGAVRLWSFRYPVQNLVLLVGAAGLGAIAGPEGAVAGVALAAGAALIVGILAIGGSLHRARRGQALPDGALRFGVHTAAAGVLGHVYQRGAVIAVAVFGGSTVEAGFAGLAIGVSLAGTYAIAQSFVVQLPTLAEQAILDLQAAEAVGRRLALRLQLLVVPVAVGAALAVDPLLPVVIGEGFRDAEAAFAPALAALPLVPLSALGSQAAALRLQAQKRTYATGAGVAVFLVVATLGVPVWAAPGATAAMLAATTVTAAILAVALPGSIDRRLAVVGFGGAGLTLAAGLLA